MQKNFIVALFGPKTSNQIIQKKSLRSILKLYVAATLSKKSETLHTLIFYRTWKTFFWTCFGSILAPKQQNNVFSINIVYPNFKSLCQCNFM